MIEVENLTKGYGRISAIRDVSFTVDRGEILGFLGPNGAGKTTTMRILTCFIPATSGTARVAGYDVFTQSLEVRRRIGYLPEVNMICDTVAIINEGRIVAKDSISRLGVEPRMRIYLTVGEAPKGSAETKSA